VRGHWGIENRLHWVLDVAFADDQSRLRKVMAQKTSNDRLLLTALLAALKLWSSNL
jgi:predicted transposase YbfD/YdcC